MRKKSHISLAKFLVHNNKEYQLSDHRKAFYIGSILPDIKPSFLTKRHTFEETFDILKDEIKKITVDYDFNKGINGYYARHLGIITHYLADYCTFPHNSCFKGTMTDHVYYEKEMKFKFREYVESNNIKRTTTHRNKLYTFDEIIQIIKTMHKEYLMALKAVKQDIHYIIELCSRVVEAILAFFDLEFESIQTGAKSELQFNHS